MCQTGDCALPGRAVRRGRRTAQALGGARSRIQRGRRAPPRRPHSWPGRAHAALARHPLQRLGDLQARDALSARPRAARSAARRATATQHAEPSRGADLCGSSAQRCALVGAYLHSHRPAVLNLTPGDHRPGPWPGRAARWRAGQAPVGGGTGRRCLPGRPVGWLLQRRPAAPCRGRPCQHCGARSCRADIQRPVSKMC